MFAKVLLNSIGGVLAGVSAMASPGCATRTVYVDRPVPVPVAATPYYQPAPQPVGQPDAAQQVVVQPSAPPAPVTGVVTVSPGPDYIWVPGAYEWSGGVWIWIGGHWDRPVHPGAIWIRGGWSHGRHGYVWHRGHWR